MSSRNGRARWVVIVAALFGMAVTAWLGHWQWSRAQEKLALQRVETERATLPDLHGPELARTSAAAAMQSGRRVRVRGEWVEGATVFLENRQMDGRPGFFAISALRLADAPGAVLVQRGWAPRRIDDRTAVPALHMAHGVVEIVGVEAPPPSRLIDFGSPGTGLVRQNIVLDDYGREIGQDLLPLSIMQSDSAATQGDGLLRRWPPPAFDIDRHYGYMVQWFGLCLLLAGLTLWFQWLKPWRARRRPAAQAEPDSSPAHRAHDS